MMKKIFILAAAAAMMMATVMVSGQEGGGGGGTEKTYGRLCENPNERLAAADKCLTEAMMFGDEEFKAPQDEAALTDFCGRTGTALQCTRKYVRECLEPFPKQLLGFGVAGAMKVRRGNCDRPDDRKEFLRHMPCLGRHVDIGHQLMRVNILSVEHIRDQMGPKAKLPGVCCTHFNFRRQLKERMSRACAESLGDAAAAAESGEFLDNMLGEATESLMEFMCGMYTNLETCDANLPQLMGKVREWTAMIDDRPDEIRPQSSSILFPLLDVFTSAS